jgi:hypothetical protein
VREKGYKEKQKANRSHQLTSKRERGERRVQRVARRNRKLTEATLTSKRVRETMSLYNTKERRKHTEPENGCSIEKEKEE